MESSSSPWPSPNLQPVSTIPSKSESVSSQLPLIPYDEESSYACTCTPEQRTEDEALDCNEREDKNNLDLSFPSSTLNPNVDDNQAPPSLLHLSFNQDYVCFSAGTSQGFRIYNCDPFRETFRHVFEEGGGIGIVEMLHRSNLLALVGGGSDPQYSPTKVMIWDDNQSKCIGELSFRSDVRAVRLRRDRVIVVLEKKIFVYNMPDLKLLHQIDTLPNPRGLCAVSPALKSFVLACPSTHEGQVRVEHFTEKKTKFIMAHDSRIACVVLSYDGKLLATASTKGTLIRIYNAVDGILLQEVRRGAGRAEIYSLTFSNSAKFLAVSSDTGTVHVFTLKVEYGSPEYYYNTHTASNLSFIKGVLPKYFSSERSICQFGLPEGCQYIVSFGHEKNTIVILGMDGSFYRCQFDPLKGGKMKQLDFHSFLSSKETF